MPLLRHVSILVAAASFAAGVAGAQAAQFSDSPNGDAPAASESSSSAGALPTDGASLAALPAAPAAQDDRGGGYHSHSVWSHLTYEAGGGATPPTGYSSPYITWGGNFTVGAGYKFDSRFSVLAEYQFIDSKLPGAFIAETGSQGGHAHIWSFTLAPVVDLLPKRTNDVYVTGGGGFYRKVTSFTDIEPAEFCSFFGCVVGEQSQVVGHFSSNQGGWNVGAGFTHRLGGVYGDGTLKLFAEARYLDVLTPALTTSANGLPVTTVGADTKIVPITLGVRW
jgi:hypothetical protein